MIKVNGIRVKTGNFPNGESVIDKSKLLESAIDSKQCVIDFKYESDIDLIHLMMVKKFIDTLRDTDIRQTVLNIAYMPYSRMDRENDDHLFTLKYVCEFINGMKFDSVFVSEAHSDVCLALLNQSTANDVSVSLAMVCMAENHFDFEKDFVMFPDAGAQKRYSKFFKSCNQIVGFKERDFETGRIVKYNMFGSTDLSGSKVIIVDDLCSGGFTFHLATQELKKIGAGDIYLAVAHCEETVLTGALIENDDMKQIYTTDSIIGMDKAHDKLTIQKRG